MTPRIRPLTSLIIIGALLSGCSSAPAPTVSPTSSAAGPSATPTPSATVETLPTLFTISARVRSVDGMSLNISLAGHPPVASTDDDAEDLVDDFDPSQLGDLSKYLK